MYPPLSSSASNCAGASARDGSELRVGPAVWDPAGAQRSSAASAKTNRILFIGGYRLYVRGAGEPYLTTVMRMVIIWLCNRSGRKIDVKSKVERDAANACGNAARRDRGVSHRRDRHHLSAQNRARRAGARGLVGHGHRSDALGRARRVPRRVRGAADLGGGARGRGGRTRDLGGGVHAEACKEDARRKRPADRIRRSSARGGPSD